MLVWEPLSKLFQTESRPKHMGLFDSTGMSKLVSPRDVPIFSLAGCLHHMKLKKAGVKWLDFVEIPAAIDSYKERRGRPRLELHIFHRLIGGKRGLKIARVSCVVCYERVRSADKWTDHFVALERERILAARSFYPEVFSSPISDVYLTKIAIELPVSEIPEIVYDAAGIYTCSNLLAFAEGHLEIQKLRYHIKLDDTTSFIHPDAFRAFKSFKKKSV